MENIFCKKCGVADNRLEKKGIHVGCYCNSCDAWIKWIQVEEPKLHFGKYKGQLVSEIPDVPYLKWALANTRMSITLKKAVSERISHIENVAR